MSLEVNVTLCLPRDELTVPVVRHLCNFAMEELGVAEECRHDVLLALTEACTNVVDHSDDTHEYVVGIRLGDERCTITVEDRGAGFDIAEHRSGTLDEGAETGRGIDLIRALVDSVSFTSEAREGTVVNMYKELAFVDDHPVHQRLLSRST